MQPQGQHSKWSKTRCVIVVLGVIILLQLLGASFYSIKIFNFRIIQSVYYNGQSVEAPDHQKFILNDLSTMVDIDLPHFTSDLDDALQNVLRRTNDSMIDGFSNDTIPMKMCPLTPPVLG